MYTLVFVLLLTLGLCSSTKYLVETKDEVDYKDYRHSRLGPGPSPLPFKKDDYSNKVIYICVVY